MMKGPRISGKTFADTMSLVLLGAKVDFPPGHNPYIIRIHSMVHHQISPVNPRDVQ